MAVLCERLRDHCFRHEVVGARLWSDGMFAECDLIIENSDRHSVHGEYINAQRVEKNLFNRYVS